MVESGNRRCRYVQAVLDAVDDIPTGRVTTYGRIAEVVRSRTGWGGPRTVGQVLARYGAGCDWFRVVRADGRLPPDPATARAALLAEGIPVTDGRVRPLKPYLWPRTSGSRTGPGVEELNGASAPARPR